jgi:predicted nucleic acid-binding Zn ribbon protein
MNTKRKNLKKPLPIGSIIPKVLRSCRLEADEELSQIWDLWDQAVGKAISENTRPAAFKGKLLLVHASSSTWIQQLQFLKKDMIRKVNEALGKSLVEEIKFKIGPL